MALQVLDFQIVEKIRQIEVRSALQTLTNFFGFTKFLYKTVLCQIKTPCCLTLKSEKTIGGEIVLHNDFLLYCTWNSPLRAEKKLENVQAHNSSIISILSCRVL